MKLPKSRRVSRMPRGFSLIYKHRFALNPTFLLYFSERISSSFAKNITTQPGKWTAVGCLSIFRSWNKLYPNAIVYLCETSSRDINRFQMVLDDFKRPREPRTWSTILWRGEKAIHDKSVRRINRGRNRLPGRSHKCSGVIILWIALGVYVRLSQCICSRECKSASIRGNIVERGIPSANPSDPPSMHGLTS